MLRERACRACDLHGFWVLTLVSARNPPPSRSNLGNSSPRLDGGGSRSGCNGMPGTGLGIVAELRIFVCPKLFKQRKIESPSPLCLYDARPFHARLQMFRLLQYCNRCRTAATLISKNGVQTSAGDAERLYPRGSALVAHIQVSSIRVQRNHTRPRFRVNGASVTSTGNPVPAVMV